MFQAFVRRAPRAVLQAGAPRKGFASESIEGLQRTAMFDLHQQLGGKMVPYAGYALPLMYSSDSVVNSHMHTRTKASLFDVSHMGQIRIWGEAREQFAEYLLPANIRGVALDQSVLSVLLNDQGGIMDDLIVTKKADHLGVVVNAACKVNDLKHMRLMLEKFREDAATQGVNTEDLKVEYLWDSHRLLALQGPQAAQALQSLLPQNFDLNNLGFMRSTTLSVAGIEDCWVSRCGYTGEDGFEISVPAETAVELAQAMLGVSAVEVKPAGLGARDTLRMEAGLCLYGNDINSSITPVEAGLAWCIPKRRREEGGFPGWEAVMKQINQGVARQRVGLLITQGAPARQDCELVLKSAAGEDAAANQVGVVTSGIFSPCLKKSIAMGYVAKEYSQPGTELGVVVRGKVGQAIVTKMPFVPTHYFIPPKPAAAAKQ